MIRPEDIAAAGNDWSGYGEVTGQPLLDLITQGRISIMFADKGILVGVQMENGQTGTYILPHVADIAHFQ